MSEQFVVSGLAPSSRHVLDQWSPLSYKDLVGDGAESTANVLIPDWAGHHRRRLNSYLAIDHYRQNSNRHQIPDLDPRARRDHREYGDPTLFIETVRSALMGETQEIVVPDAADFDPDLEERLAHPEPPPEPKPNPIPGLPPIPPDEPPPPPSDEEVKANAAAAIAFQRQEWLRKWSERDNFDAKLIETERNSCGFGDGVYVLGWHNAKRRPRVLTYEPDAYFPVLSDDLAGDEYPRKVHLAYEIVSDDDGVARPIEPGDPGRPGDDSRKVRRITFELVPWEPWTPEYAEDGDEPSTEMCVMTDATFQLHEFKNVDDLTPATAVYEITEDRDGQLVEVNRLPLMLDFVPVVHIPNTVNLVGHYGVSCISNVAQVFDDEQNCDTDLAAAADTTGVPPVFTSGTGSLGGKGGAIETYSPGQVFRLGAGGAMTQLDTSHNLDALLAFREALGKTASVNGRVAEALLGRISPSEVPSGLALALGFGPTSSMISELRLVRKHKYRILLRMVQRIAMQAGPEAGGLEKGPVLPATLELGAFLPIDKAATVEMVTKLYAAKVVSLSTSVQLLVAAGFKIEDASEEVRRIEREDFAAASAMLDATGDEKAVRDRLGLKGPGPRPEPQIPPGTPIPGQPVPGAPAPPGPQPPAPGGVPQPAGPAPAPAR